MPRLRVELIMFSQRPGMKWKFRKVTSVWTLLCDISLALLFPNMLS